MGEQGPRNDRLLMGMMVGPRQSGGGGPGSGSLSDGCPGLRSHHVDRQDKVPPSARHWYLGLRFAIASTGLWPLRGRPCFPPGLLELVADVNQYSYVLPQIIFQGLPIGHLVFSTAGQVPEEELGLLFFKAHLRLHGQSPWGCKVSAVTVANTFTFTMAVRLALNLWKSGSLATCLRSCSHESL